MGLHEHLDAYTFWMIIAFEIVGDLFVNYLSIYIKRVQIKHEYVFYLFLATIAALLLLDQLKVVNLQAISSAIFMQALHQPLWLLPGILLFGAALLTSTSSCYTNTLLWKTLGRAILIKEAAWKTLATWIALEKIGAFALLELKMYVRNKRPRTMLFVAPLFLLYGLFFYTKPTYQEVSGFLILIGIFISGGFMMNFGLYFFAWESGHFDSILTANNTYKDYIKAKYFLMLATGTIIFLLSTFYIYFGVKILVINGVCFLFNIGVNSLLLLYFATNNTKHMDLSKGSAFNYQGVSGRHFVLIIPLLVIPIFIYLPFGIMDQANVGFALIGILGILGLLLREKMLDLITRRFIRKRYKMSEGFRNQ
jgi:hypothetical protein